MIPVDYYLFLSLALFTIGVIGVLTRRNVIIMLMSIELILNAVNINLMVFRGCGARWTGKCSRFSLLQMRQRRLRWDWASFWLSSTIARPCWRMKWTS